VQAAAADADLIALLRGAVQEPGEPSEWDADDATVAEIDPHAVRVEADSGWANRRTHDPTLLHFLPLLLG
jgi:hypothetical protein